MSDSVEVRVTANVDDLRSALGQASASVRQFQTDVTAMSAAAQSSAARMSQMTPVATGLMNQMQSLARATQQAGQAQQSTWPAAIGLMNQMKSQAESAAGGAEHLGHATGGITRELIVLAHEMAMGNFTRLGGSMMVLSERSGAVTAGLAAMAGGMWAGLAVTVALAGGLVILALRAHEAEVAMRGIYNAALLQGRGAAQAEQAARGQADAMRDAGTIGYKASLQITEAINTIPGVADDVRGKLAAIAPALFETWGRSAEDTAKNIDNAFRTTGGLQAFLTENQLLTSSQQQAFHAAQITGDAYGAQRIAVDALTARLGPAYAEFKRQNDQAKEYAANVQVMGEAAATLPNLTEQATLPPLRMPQLGTQAEGEDTRQQQAAVQTLNAANEERLKLTTEITRAQAALTAATSAGDAAGAARAKEAIANGQAELDKVTSASQEEAYAKVGQAAQDAANQAVVAASNAGRSRVQITEAGVQAEIAVYRQAAADETLTVKQREAAQAEAVRLGTSLVKEEAGATETAAKQGYAAKVAAYDQEIAAAKGNAQQIEALEEQKLAFIKSVHGEASAQYQEALKSDTEAVASAVNQQIRAIEDGGKRSLASQKQVLADELATHQITKAQEAQQALEETQAERDAELASLSTLITSLQEGTAAYKDAIAKRTALIQDFGTRLQQLQTQQDAATTQSADKMMQVYVNAFDKIGQSANSALTGYLTYQTTWQKAEEQVVRSVLTSFISLGEQMVERWAATQIAMTMDSATQNAVRTAQNTASSSGWTQLLESVFAKFTAQQTGMTAANAVGTAARTSTTIAGATTSSAVQGAAAGKTVMSDAAQAFSGVYASASQIPYVGWIIAPVAAAAAFAAVAGYEGLASLDTGTSYVPHDMVARIHQGEMVVPRFESDAFRSAIGGGTTNNSSSGGPVSITHAPVFNGVGAGTAAQLGRANDAFMGKLMDTFRNGQLRLPGR